MPRSRRDHIEGALDTAVSKFMYYDRKKDEDLPRGQIEEAVASGEITYEEIADLFRSILFREMGSMSTGAINMKKVEISRRDGPDEVADAFVKAINDSGYAHATYVEEDEDTMTVLISARQP